MFEKPSATEWIEWIASCNV